MTDNKEVISWRYKKLCWIDKEGLKYYEGEFYKEINFIVSIKAIRFWSNKPAKAMRYIIQNGFENIEKYNEQKIIC